jgi:beta-glucuronidase
MQQFDWFNYGGIYRDVELIRLPPVFIRDLRVHLVPDGRYDKIAVRVELSWRLSKAKSACGSKNWGSLKRSG